MMFGQRTMSLGSLFECERAIDVDFKRSGLNQVIEFFDCGSARNAIVSLHANSGARLVWGFDAMGIGDASAVSNAGEDHFQTTAGGSKENGIDAGRGEFAKGLRYVAMLAIDEGIGTKLCGEGDAVIAGSDCQDASTMRLAS